MNTKQKNKGVSQIQTDHEFNEVLNSTLVYVIWNVTKTRVGSKSEFEVRTAFIGDGSKIHIRGEGEAYGPFGGIDDKIYNNRYIADLPIPDDIQPDDKIWFTAKLPAHGIEEMSEKIPVLSSIQLVSMQWSAPVARRGDILTLKADFLGARDKADCIVHILEYDQDGNHDPIVSIPSEINNGKLQLQWEYQYYEDTDEIPTEEELQEYGRHYNPPEYFFVVEIDGEKFGEKQESGLILFKDWLEINILNIYNMGIKGENINFILPNGENIETTTDDFGLLKLKDVHPGAVKIIY